MSLSVSSRSSSIMEKKQTMSSSESFLEGLFKAGDDNNKVSISSPTMDIVEFLSKPSSILDQVESSTTIVQNSWSPICSANVDFSTSSPMMDIDNNDNDTIMMDPNNGCSLISTSFPMMDIDNNDNDTIMMDAISPQKKKMIIKMEKKRKLRLKLKNTKKKAMKIMKKSSVRVQQLKENEKMPKEKMMAVKFTVFFPKDLKGLKALKRVTIKQKNQVKKRKSSQRPVSSKTIAISGGKRRKVTATTFTTTPCVVVEETFSDDEIAVAEKKTAADADAAASTLVVATTAATATATATATSPCVVATTAAFVANEEHCYDNKSDQDKITTSTSSTVSLSSMSSSSNNDSDSSLSHNKDDGQPATTVTALTPLTLRLPTTPKSVKTMINFDWGYKDAINNDDGPFLQALRKEHQCNEEFGCDDFDCVRCR